MPTPQPPAADAAQAAATARAWWQAFTLADTAHLRAHTTPDATLTLSSGLTLDGPGILRQAATHTSGARLTIEWLGADARLVAPTVAVVTSRMRESEGLAVMTYRYVTLLATDPRGDWRVAAAQSTRELTFSPRAAVAEAGVLADFAGAYRTPRGGTLRVLARDSGLVLVEPSGAELPLDPIGPGLFEFGALSPSNGVVRFVFTRDAGGRVASMARLVPGTVTAFPRVP